MNGSFGFSLSAWLFNFPTKMPACASSLVGKKEFNSRASRDRKTKNPTKNPPTTSIQTHPDPNHFKQKLLPQTARNPINIAPLRPPHTTFQQFRPSDAMDAGGCPGAACGACGPDVEPRAGCGGGTLGGGGLVGSNLRQQTSWGNLREPRQTPQKEQNPNNKLWLNLFTSVQGSHEL